MGPPPRDWCGKDTLTMLALTSSSATARASLLARPAYLQGTAVRRSHAPIATSRVAGMSVSARYRGKGTDLSAVPSFQNSAKDYAAQRGLLMILGQRKSLLKYLYAQDRELYMRTVSELGIRDKLSMLI